MKQQQTKFPFSVQFKLKDGHLTVGDPLPVACFSAQGDAVNFAKWSYANSPSPHSTYVRVWEVLDKKGCVVYYAG